jgi:DNA-binding transcriptional regulator YiaG
MTPQEIIDIRTALGRTRAGLAQIVGATEMSVTRWETGKTRPIPVFTEKLKKLQDWVAKQKQAGIE